MRTLGQLLAILAICGAGCFLVQFCPPVVFGTATNFITGQPIPNARILLKEMNGASEGPRTDARGHFWFAVPNKDWCCYLYVAPPDAGPLLQASLLTVFPVRNGEIHLGVRVLAVPATELAGRVYDETGKPLAGCEVQALTYVPLVEPPLKQIAFKRTDQSGAFRFTELGSDRYFVLVRCRRFLPGDNKNEYDWRSLAKRWKNRDSWPPAWYPNSTTLGGAHAILLKPGDRVQNIDFHLQAIPQYSLHGTVTVDNGPKTYPGVGHWIDPFTVAISRKDLSALAFPPHRWSDNLTEPCGWLSFNKEFQCEFLSPGAYTLHFSIWGGNGESYRNPSQENVNVEVGPKGATAPIRLHFTYVSPHVERAPTSPMPVHATGSLILQTGCPANWRDAWIKVTASGTGWLRKQNNSWLEPCYEPIEATLATGTYTLQAEVFGAFSSPKLQELLGPPAQSVTVQQGVVTRIKLKVWTPEQAIRIGLNSLSPG